MRSRRSSISRALMRREIRGEDLLIDFGFRAGAVLSGSLALPACRQSPAQDAHAVRRAPVTFTKDISPILLQHCATCHRPVDQRNAATSPAEPWCFAGAPFSLIEYADARDHARQIAEATRTLVMPPWLPEKA